MSACGIAMFVLMGLWAAPAREAPVDAQALLAEAAGASAEAARLLAAGGTGDDVQALQERVAETIAQLATELAPQGGASMDIQGESADAQLTRQGTKTSEPELPGEESVLPAGQWAVGRLEGSAGAARWQPELPPTALKEITDAFAEGRLPAYYRERLRAYGRSLAGEEAAAAAAGVLGR